MKTNLKIYNPIWGVNSARDWGLEAEAADISTVLQEPYRIACVPACFNNSNNFNFQFFPESQKQIDFSKFNLVIISDIEQEKYSEILKWIEKSKINNYLLSIGAIHNGNAGINNETTILRSWWMYNLMRLNSYDDHMRPNKPFWFDVLLGTRKPHRDFVMLNLQKHRPLLDKCVVTYREGFPGEVINRLTTDIHNYFPEYSLTWPYISPNLDPAWELKDALGKIDGPVQSISPYVTGEIYKHTWYTVICESNHDGDSFFLTEKTTKVLYAKRVFVMYAPAHFLKNLRNLGFKTFGSIIDESYDEELVDIIRYQKVFAQMLSLTQQDPIEVHTGVNDILEHNQRRLTELQNETNGRMQELLQRHIPIEYQLS
jgi:hypothetical protein